MAMLSTSRLSVSFGTNRIFQDVSFEIQAGDRVGLIGVNGSGKTTLLKTLMRVYTPESGTVSIAKDTQIGYMEQHVCRDLDRTAYAEVLTVFEDLLQMEQELQTLSQEITIHPTDERIARQAALNERFVQQGGLTCRARARSTLLGLGFSDALMQQTVSVLSGGQRAKLQLAKLLLSGANLLLLDEPTNHLDLQSVEWLEEFLRNWKGAFLVISHDRYFLDRLCSRMFELENGRLTTYKGNYTAFQEQKDLQELTVERQYQSTMQEINRMQAMVSRLRRWNRQKSIKTAESKEKAIARLERTLVVPESERETLQFQFPVAERSGNDVLQVENLALRFGEHSLFQTVNLELHRGERVFLLGPNGCGKTSLLKTLLRQYTPDAGRIRFGANVKVGYYDQLQTGLHPEKRVIDEIWDTYPQMTETQVRSFLAAFLFFGDDVFKSVSTLSGGERARVLLLRLMLSKANFLLLDEPTNHLDISSSEALEAALENYEGTLFVVSHDRYFINRLADRIYWLTPDGAVSYTGHYDAFLEQRKAARKTAPPACAKTAKTENLYLQKKAGQAALRKQKAALRRLENQIEELETQMAACNQQLSTPEIAADYEKALELTQQLSKIKAESDRLFQQWEQLSETIETGFPQGESN